MANEMVKKEIRGNPGYFVTPEGFVFHGENQIKAGKSSNGYMTVCLPSIGGSKTVHRIVAETFIPNPDRKPCVNHINGDKSDNRVENLEWVTHSENAIHAYKNGLKKVDMDECRKAKRRKCVRDDGVVFESLAEAARKSGTNTDGVYKSCNGIYKTTNGYSFKYVED